VALVLVLGLVPSEPPDVRCETGGHDAVHAASGRLAEPIPIRVHQAELVDALALKDLQKNGCVDVVFVEARP
jgi:hypothetical protein